MRVFLDSDVILDLVLCREPDVAIAHEIFRSIARHEFEAFTSAVVIVNVHYFAKKEKDGTFAIAEVKNLLTLLDILSIHERTLQQAIALPIKDFEDAVQCAAAVAEGLDSIVTRNVKDFANSPLPVYSPAEFVKLIQTEHASEESD